MTLNTWRIIEDGAAAGAWNMALDEALLESTGSGQSLPVLRLYRWDPPCLSLGYAQPAEDVDFSLLHAHGWDVVRRPTGGRAILHTDELTYAVIAPPGEPRVAGSVLESYQRLSQALLAALRKLGLPAQADQEYAQPAGSRADNPVCFERPSNYEITANGKKLIGSAQARRREGILQHGSLPLTGDLTRITQVLSFNSEAERQQAAARLLERATTVEMVSGRVVTWDEAAAAFRAAFSSVLGIHFEATPPSPVELARAEELVEQKYGNPAWIQRV